MINTTIITPENLLPLTPEHPLYLQALAFAGHNRHTSVAALQRHLRQGYNFTMQLRALLVSNGVLDEMPAAPSVSGEVHNIVAVSATVTLNPNSSPDPRTEIDDNGRRGVVAHSLAIEHKTPLTADEASLMARLIDLLAADADSGKVSFSLFAACPTLTDDWKNGDLTMTAAQAMTDGSVTLQQTMAKMLGDPVFGDLFQADRVLVIVNSRAGSLLYQSFADVQADIAQYLSENCRGNLAIIEDQQLPNEDCLKIQLFACKWSQP
jgi:hypothetical protein